MAGADPEKSSGSRCDEVIRDVWLFLDDEMDPENRAAVQRHLDDCSPCLAEAGIDEKLKHLLHRKCGGERAPEHLRVRLVARLATISAALRDDDGSSVQVTASTLTVTAERSQNPANPAAR